MPACSSTSPAMTESGVGDPPSSLLLTDSSKVSLPHQFSSRQTLPTHSTSKWIVLTSPPAQCSPRCVPLMANGTRSHSSPSPYHQSNATMRSMTRRCSQSSGPCRSGTTSSKELNTSSRSGWIIRTWSTLCWQNSSTGDKLGGHFTSLSAAETLRKNQSLKPSRSSRSPQPIRFVHKSGPSKRDFCTSMAASMSHQLQTSTGR